MLLTGEKGIPGANILTTNQHGFPERGPRICLSCVYSSKVLLIWGFEKLVIINLLSSYLLHMLLSSQQSLEVMLSPFVDKKIRLRNAK